MVVHTVRSIQNSAHSSLGILCAALISKVLGYNGNPAVFGHFEGIAQSSYPTSNHHKIVLPDSRIVIGETGRGCRYLHGARRELAYSLNNIGATYTAIGKSREALDLFTTCLEMREKLSKQFPDDISIQQDIGMTYGNIAYANSLLGNAEVALAAERRAKTIRQSLYDENPAITDFQTGLAKSFDSDGFYFLKRGESLLAKDAFLEAAKYQSMAVEGNPDVVELRGTLARLYNNAGSAIARTDMKAATEQFQKALHVQEEIARLYPSFARYRSELAQSYQNVGLAMRFEKNFDSALANYEKAIKVLTELVEERPDVPEYKTDICKNLHNMAVIKNLSKLHEQALEILGRAIAMQKSLCERHPENPLYARELARSFNTRSEAYAGLDNLELALANRETAVEMLRKLVEAAPTNYDFGNGLSTGLSALGRIQMKMNKLLEAQQTLRGAIAQVRNLSQPSPSLIFRIAEDYGMLAKLGKMREDKDGERVETSPIVNGVVANGNVVKTGSGSRYFLSDTTPSSAKTDAPLKSLLSALPGATIQLTKDAKDKEAKRALAAVTEAKPRSTFSLFGLGGGSSQQVVSKGTPSIKVSSSPSIPIPKKATTTGAASKKVSAAPRGVPTITRWRKNRDGSISGLIFGSNAFKDGERITTSAIAQGTIQSGQTVKTGSGSRYYLE